VSPEAVRVGIIWITVLVLVAVSAPSAFLSVANVANIGLSVAVTGVVAVGLTLAISTGAVDLSYPVVMSLSGITLAVLLESGWPLLLALAGTLCVAALVGLTNGALSVVFGVDPLITTLATNTILVSLLIIFTGSEVFAVAGETIEHIGRGRIGSIPVPLIIFAACAILGALILTRTVIGQKFTTVGNNSLASRLTGIRVARVQVTALVVSAAFAGIGGVLMAANTGYVTAADGERYLLPVIAAVVLGGTAVSGGRGSVAGTTLGVLVLGTIGNGMNIHNLGSSSKMIVEGLVVLGSMAYYAKSMLRKS